MAVIEFNIENRIGMLTFNRPEALNALNREVLNEFSKLIKAMPTHNCGVVIMTGAGEKSFIAGADIKEMATMTPLQASEFSGLAQGALTMMEKLPQVFIAAVNGFALGGGCEFAMAADLIYAAETAKFSQPELNLGVTPGFGGTQRLPRLVGPMKAREMIYTGAPIDAHEAYRIGLVAQVFPAASLMEEVKKIAEKILGKSPEATRRAKSAMKDGASEDLYDACALEREQFASCFSHPNRKEGMEAFMAKRKPNWGASTVAATAAAKAAKEAKESEEPKEGTSK